MIGRLITCDKQEVTLPKLLAWNITYTGSVPCDCFTVTCPCMPQLGALLHKAESFLALHDGDVVLHGIVDEFTINWTAGGQIATIEGRGIAARLLDNESRPVIYEQATLADIIRNHVTPYGIECGKKASLRSSQPYTVTAGRSQWRVLDDFCRALGGWSPRFTPKGELIAVPGDDSGRHILIDQTTKVLACRKRENHYGVLSEVLEMDKSGHGRVVKNEPFLARGGMCRRVLVRPAKPTFANNQYDGAYQLERSGREEITIELTLAGVFLAFPDDTIELQLPDGLTGIYRVDKVRNSVSKQGARTMLTLQERTK